MSDPSQPNDEGITALHNAICGGHYAVVEFLVRIGANVSAPDSHSWLVLDFYLFVYVCGLCVYLSFVYIFIVSVFYSVYISNQKVH